MKPSNLQLTLLKLIGREGRDLWAGDESLLELAQAAEADAPHLLHVTHGHPTIGKGYTRASWPKASIHLLQGGRAAIDGAVRTRERERKRKIQAEVAASIANSTFLALRDADHAMGNAPASSEQGRAFVQARIDLHHANERVRRLSHDAAYLMRERYAAKSVSLSGVARVVLMMVHEEGVMIFDRSKDDHTLFKLVDMFCPDLITKDSASLSARSRDCVEYYRLTIRGEMVASRLSRGKPVPAQERTTISEMESILAQALFGRRFDDGPMCLDELEDWARDTFMALLSEHGSWFGSHVEDGHMMISLRDEGREVFKAGVFSRKW